MFADVASDGVTTTDLVFLAVIVVLLGLSVFLALAETALTRMTPSKAAALAEEGRWGSRQLVQLVDEPERFLNPVLLVVLVCQLMQASLTGLLADRLFGGWGFLIATIVNVGVVFVLAEAAPKTWALLNAERAALLSAPPILALTKFWPIRLLSRGLIGLTNILLPGKGLKKGPFVSEAEILALADVAVEEDVIDSGERELIEQIIEFGDTVAREVMVPRPDMITVPADFRVADVMEVVILNGFSRIPAFGSDNDDIVGIVFAKDLMRAERDGKADNAVSESMREARFVPETKRVAELLREMQAEQFHMAMVVDEYGGIAGLVTLEDLIEELVGEIVDEFDREEPMVEPLAGGGVRVHARMNIDEVNELITADLPEGDWDTVGGFLYNLLGHVPVEGESAEYDGYVLRAERVQGRRIGRVRITPRPGGAPSTATAPTERPSSKETADR